ncbi:ribonuclease G [Balneicella halophila]|uniref:Ribonuclease G n=1 Tax=Balneicella halophila TaxID=1537566 RepID=A0A7L4UQ55_BALHA|nr:Rne/Rng family ribonuclease [Balneicella halophila]PVX51915.1 ribonuclease G [Balneicella halophila]
MSKELVIDVQSDEIHIALLKDKKLQELNQEKKDNQFAVGDIYLARVKKLMPSLNACFVEVGFEKAGFLHYLDLGGQFNSINKFLKIVQKNKNTLSHLSKMQLLPDISKDGKISEAVSEGQQLLVQIAKEPISTKGPRLTSEISIAGRHLVLIPCGNKVSISQKIDSAEERKRLKNLLESITPRNYGIIVRTVAEGKTASVLDKELRGLVKKFENSLMDISASTKAPKLVLSEINRTETILRDILDDSIEGIYVNDRETYYDVKDYIQGIAPEMEKVVKREKGDIPIFEKYDINSQLKKGFGRTVSFGKQGYLVIEHTEACHVIDVNSGNRTKATDQETNALNTNMAAAEEIARQLRLRDMGGIIVVDFIDMNDSQHRQKLHSTMKEAMSGDRARHNILPLSKFGLMQITRQRVRPVQKIDVREACPTCKGTGKIEPTISIVDDIQNKIEQSPLKNIILQVHPFIEAYLNRGFWKTIRKEWQKKYNKKIVCQALSTLDISSFNIIDPNEIKKK